MSKNPYPGKRQLTFYQAEILDFAKRHNEGFHIRELHQVLYYKRGERFRTLQGKICRLKKRGLLQMIKPGVYTISA